jgi:hypothetical protein
MNKKLLALILVLGQVEMILEARGGGPSRGSSGTHSGASHRSAGSRSGTHSSSRTRSGRSSRSGHRSGSHQGNHQGNHGHGYSRSGARGFYGHGAWGMWGGWMMFMGLGFLMSMPFWFNQQNYNQDPALFDAINEQGKKLQELHDEIKDMKKDSTEYAQAKTEMDTRSAHFQKLIAQGDAKFKHELE